MVASWIGFGAGLLMVLGTLMSVAGTLVVPRAVFSPASRAVELLLDVVFRILTKPVRSFARRDAILSWQAPMSLLVRLAAWLGMLIVGFALLLLPSLKGHLGQAFSESGSSMFTLGYAVPSTGDSTTLEYLAAFTGLVVIGLQVGYLPTLYAAFNKRETEVTLLATRAGVPSWGPELLARTRWGIQDGDMAQVLETLCLYLGTVGRRSGRIAHHLSDAGPVPLAAAVVALAHLVDRGDGCRRPASVIGPVARAQIGAAACPSDGLRRAVGDRSDNATSRCPKKRARMRRSR